MLSSAAANRDNVNPCKRLRVAELIGHPVRENNCVKLNAEYT